MAQIKCDNVSLAYDGSIIVSDLNFEVKSGDYLCIVGENGSGKSTLVKTLLGLKTPNSGSVVFGVYENEEYAKAAAEKLKDKYSCCEVCTPTKNSYELMLVNR